jgi:hypothetical protein
MSDSYIDRIKREGPLPKAEDDSELVGKDDKKGGAAAEHGADFVTLPVAGAGAFPVPNPAPPDHEAADGQADDEAVKAEK